MLPKITGHNLTPNLLLCVITVLAYWWHGSHRATVQREPQLLPFSFSDFTLNVFGSEAQLFKLYSNTVWVTCSLPSSFQT
uniref:Secreted protein n=1 Tax=Pyxicephalus adspersus TaxID=30357 RepID=A0AAV3AYU8_PYXAD|nr:TPA: hypothetical protein GDO54_008409 [Pyxicephalus adspersus]